MFSQTQEYALRAVVWLASHTEEGPVGHTRIAEETAVPASYLSKVLQALARHGLVDSKRGAGGGFQLARDATEMSVLEVVNAVDPLRRIQSCPLGLKTHQKTLCPMHARLDKALESVEVAFAASTIAELLSEPGRPTPLVEMPPPRKRSRKNAM